MLGNFTLRKFNDIDIDGNISTILIKNFHYQLMGILLKALSKNLWEKFAFSKI